MSCIGLLLRTFAHCPRWRLGAISPTQGNTSEYNIERAVAFLPPNCRNYGKTGGFFMAKRATKKATRKRPTRTPKKKQMFLDALSDGIPNVARACRVAGVGRRTVYDWRATDPEFAEQWEIALDDAVDFLVESAWARATKEHAPSDTLAIFLLKAHRREVYGERQVVEHAGKVEVDSAKEKLGKLLSGASVPIVTPAETNGVH